MKNFLKNYKKYFFEKNSYTIFVFLVGLLIVISPVLNYKIGNIFFGQVKKLYNVDLAQFFFYQSSYPVFGKSVPYSHHQLSRTHFIKGDLIMALDEAEKELIIYPDNYKTYYILGLTYGYMNREEKAIDAFSKYLEFNPGSWAGRNDMAWLQFRTGDITGALETITPVAYLTNSPWIQNTYGTLLMNKGSFVEAKKAFDNAWSAVTTMTKESWGVAYPGNDPRIYGAGIEAMRNSIRDNLKLLGEKMGK